MFSIVYRHYNTGKGWSSPERLTNLELMDSSAGFFMWDSLVGILWLGFLDWYSFVGILWLGFLDWDSFVGILGLDSLNGILWMGFFE